MANKTVLPYIVDITPDGKIVKKSYIGQEGYAENHECTLSETRTRRGELKITYYCEDGYFLSEKQIEYIFNNRKSLI